MKKQDGQVSQRQRIIAPVSTATPCCRKPAVNVGNISTTSFWLILVYSEPSKIHLLYHKIHRSSHTSCDSWLDGVRQDAGCSCTEEHTHCLMLRNFRRWNQKLRVSSCLYSYGAWMISASRSLSESETQTTMSIQTIRDQFLAMEKVQVVHSL